jgi:hypothetical protein
METIKSITEAFSMQPVTLSITDILKRDKFYPKNDIKEIKTESHQIGENDRILYYAGYNFEGIKKFQYIAKAVNVHYV